MRLGLLDFQITEDARGPILLISLVLGLLLNYALLRRTRRTRRRLQSRLVATNLALVCLLWIGLRPAWLVQSDPVAALLVTPDATEQQIQAARQRLGSGHPDFVLGQDLPNAGALRRRHPEVQRLEVAGPGLDAAEWEDLGPMPIGFAPPTVRGLVRASWNRTLVLGEDLIVQGTLADPSEGRLLLRDPGGEETVLPVTPGPEFTFQLRATPRQRGPWQYILEFQDATGLPRFHESLDVEVQPPRRLRVLWLEGTPRFETKFFKDWMAAQGGVLAIRSTVSRDRFRQEHMNEPRQDLTQLEASLLGSFDLLVADPGSLAGLGPDSLQALREAVLQRGLGVLVLADQQTASLETETAPQAEGLGFFLDWQLTRPERPEEAPVLPIWPAVAALKPSALPAESIAIRAGPGIQSLIVDGQGNILAALRRRGLGSVGFSVLRNSYRWALEGQKSVHAAYWSLLGQELAGPIPRRWALPAEGPILQGRPLQLELETSQSQPEAWVQTGAGPKEPLALRQDPREPSRWTGTYWPRAAGWYRVGQGEQAETGFQAQSDTTWTAWQQMQRLDATQRAAAKTAQPAAPPSRPQPLSLLWPYLLFLASMAFLWIDEKR